MRFMDNVLKTRDGEKKKKKRREEQMRSIKDI